ncbi:MAG: hypothetical protein K2W95_02860 [Candidatus Obscuribacterales bacterium]|nr:hypothetical protein [Candidatus Obscuribacterales bacterium]
MLAKDLPLDGEPEDRRTKRSRGRKIAMLSLVALAWNLVCPAARSQEQDPVQPPPYGQPPGTPTPPPAYGQPPGSPQPTGVYGQPPPNTAPKKPFKRDKKEFLVQDLKGAPELPGLSPFPVIANKSEFGCGQLAPNTSSGQIYTLMYRTRDSGPAVLNWYETAFRSGPWTATRLGNMIQASMNNSNGVSCSVFLLRSTKPAFPTSFVVLYTIPPPKQKKSE